MMKVSVENLEALQDQINETPVGGLVYVNGTAVNRKTARTMLEVMRVILSHTSNAEIVGVAETVH